MARTPSSMVPLGTPMPAFELKTAEGNVHTSTSLSGPNGLLVIFLCNHCPFVVHLADALGELGDEFRDLGLGIVGITSNDVTNRAADAPEHMPAFAAAHGIGFPYLFDPTQQVARSFDATCTPDFFLYDNTHTLVYRGQFDNTRPGDDATVTGADLRNAMHALCQQSPIDPKQIPSMGCNIKWKAACSCGKTS
ncbi:MAG: thioredoxin family protein [Phycisphaerae bacterium]|jgi:peroxiredoxin|nr:thioredoxin family protein [Phycisphaerae bacterium]MBT5382817.1 thioredoxin family protein [Phycisphaerae bacterium]MBT5583377.1 thioredoxin family protein [Phycisphaerae bacterium]MBT5656530.1 thioredoxin family protein [Phycisphaerae bacterium]